MTNKITAAISNDDTTLYYLNKACPIALKRITGSRMYGTQYEKGEHPFDPEYVSDYDYRGIFIAPTQDRLSLIDNVPEQVTVKDGNDTEIYDVLKFFQLAIDNNPNIMDILFGDEESLLFANDIGREIINNKHLFISQKAKDSFNGYAMQQLYRMKQHHRWAKTYPEIYQVESFLKKSFLDNEIDFQWIADYFSGDLACAITGENAQEHEHLERTISIDEFSLIHNIDFNLNKFLKPHVFEYLNVKDVFFNKIDKSTLSKNDFSMNTAYTKLNETIFLVYKTGSERDSIFSRDGNLKKSAKKIDPELKASYVVSLNISDFKKDCKEIDSIWNWKVNRNEKRAAIEKRFGYDVKHGMHLYRLLISARDLLITGTYTPRLSGDSLVMAKNILSGKIEYKDLILLSENLSKELNGIVKNNETPLQKEANIIEINKLLMKIYSQF